MQLHSKLVGTFITTGNLRALVAVLSLVAVFFVQGSALAEINRLNLGAHFDASGSDLTFRVYSSRATRIELYLYAQPANEDEAAHLPLDPDAATGVWSITLPLTQIRQAFGISGTIYYGYRARGPNWPFDPAWKKGRQAGFKTDVDSNGNRFNPNKLLFDPYAKELSHDPITPSQRDGTIYASGPVHFLQDTGRVAPKGIVLNDQPIDTGSKPSRALKDDIIYEVHLRGLTESDESVPKPLRGTYAGAAMKVAYLQSLGITAVEFLPVQETQNDANELIPISVGGDDYWGYSTLNYFALTAGTLRTSHRVDRLASSAGWLRRIMKPGLRCL